MLDQYARFQIPLLATMDLTLDGEGDVPKIIEYLVRPVELGGDKRIALDRALQKPLKRAR